MGDFIDSGFLDDYGNPIMIDAATGEVAAPNVYGSTEAPVIIDPNDPRYQDYGSPGSGISYIVRPGMPVAQYVDSVPQTPTAALLASGFDLTKLVSDAAGVYYKYKSAMVNGQRTYTAVPVNPRTGLFGMSPTMLMAIGLVGYIALGKGK